MQPTACKRMRQGINKWIQWLPVLFLVPLWFIPPLALGSFYWGIGILLLGWAIVRIVLFLIRVLWELADKSEADPDMSEILGSLLTVGVMILAFCSLTACRHMAREQALSIAVRIQADCTLYGECPASILPRHIQDGAPDHVGGWMGFPLRYDPSRKSDSFALEVVVSYRERLVVEGGTGKAMKWYNTRN